MKLFKWLWHVVRGLLLALAAAVQRCLDGADALLGAVTVHAFRLEHARLHRGLVVSGDLFVSSAAQSAALRELLPDALAVEMEGAAVAQRTIEQIRERKGDAAAVTAQRALFGA